MQTQNIEALEGRALERISKLHSQLGMLMVKQNLNDTQAHLDELIAVKFGAEMLAKNLGTVINQIFLAIEEDDL